MSTMGTNAFNSVLPEDIEKRLKSAQEIISTIEGKIVTAQNELEAKELEFKIINSKVEEATADYNNKVAKNEDILNTIKDRETKLAQKESALNVYTSALEEKEKKINKYLSIFENMKDVIR